ncbi:hypothetical protein D3C87_1348300 [compost metagenome]
MSLGNVQPGLQSTDSDVDIGRLCCNRQSRGGRARLAGLVLGECGFASASQAAKDINFPASIEVELVKTSVPIIARHRVQNLAEWRLDGLVGARGLAIDAPGGQQGGICGTQSCPCLCDSRCRLRQIQVLFKSLGDEVGQHGISKTIPPAHETGRHGCGPVLDSWLTQITIGKREGRSLIVRPDRTAGHQTGGHQKSDRVQRRHLGSFNED